MSGHTSQFFNIVVMQSVPAMYWQMTGLTLLYPPQGI